MHTVVCRGARVRRDSDPELIAHDCSLLEGCCRLALAAACDARPGFMPFSDPILFMRDSARRALEQARIARNITTTMPRTQYRCSTGHRSSTCGRGMARARSAPGVQRRSAWSLCASLSCVLNFRSRCRVMSLGPILVTARAVWRVQLVAPAHDDHAAPHVQLGRRWTPTGCKVSHASGDVMYLMEDRALLDLALSVRGIQSTVRLLCRQRATDVHLGSSDCALPDWLVSRRHPDCTAPPDGTAGCTYAWCHQHP